MIENSYELISQLEETIETATQAIQQFKESKVLTLNHDASLVEQIKQSEEAISHIHLLSQQVNQWHTNMNELLIHQLLLPIDTNLTELRQRYLEEETDTPREAAENIKRYIENPSDRGLLLSALKWIKTQVPPTVEEIETIPFETARIDDSSLYTGEEIIETPGADGEVKIIFEVTEIDGEEVKTEIERTTIKEMVREIIRVGTKEIKAPEAPEEDEEPGAEE